MTAINRQMDQIVRLLTLSMIGSALLFVLFVKQEPLNSSPTDADTTSDYEQSAFEALRFCYAKRKTLNGNATLWRHISMRIQNCIRLLTNINVKSFVRFNMGRFGEKKVFLPLAFENNTCTALTVGIGGDTKVN